MFTLSCLWLSHAQLKACTRRLDELWSEDYLEDATSGGIIFRWAEWLRHEALGEIGVLNGGDTVGGLPGGRIDLFLETTDAKGASSSCDGSDDPRAICERGDRPDEDVRELLRYDFAIKEQRWREMVVTCPICMDDQSGSLCVRGMGGACDHICCKLCLAAMAQSAVDAGGDVDDIKCPQPDCKMPMPAALLAQLVPAPLFERWEAKKKEKLLLQMPGLCYCPRCDPSSADYKARHSKASKTELCKHFALGKCLRGAACEYAHGEAELVAKPKPVPCLPVDNSDLCICPECSFSFCAACQESYHPGVECVSSEAREEYLKSRERLLSEQGGSTSSLSSKLAAARAKLEEFKSLDTIRKTSKSCPSCGAAISKTEGCNHMKCGFCSSHFCWQCGQVISDKNPYDHFRTGVCVVFPDIPAAREANNRAPVLDEEQRREDALVWRQLQRANRAAQREARDFNLVKRCPFCGFHNIKGADGSNHHRCEQCNSAFCFLCAADLRRGVKGHFTRQHPQHS